MKDKTCKKCGKKAVAFVELDMDEWMCTKHYKNFEKKNKGKASIEILGGGK